MKPAIMLPDGGMTRLADFRGHKLALFFCPHGEPAAGEEIEAYQSLAGEFEKVDTWVIGLGGPPAACAATRQSPCISVGLDPDGTAFEALKPNLPSPPPPVEGDGAAFIFDRCGAVRAALAGHGHAKQALACAAGLP